MCTRQLDYATQRCFPYIVITIYKLYVPPMKCVNIVIQLCQDVQFRVIFNIFIKVHATITGLVTDPVSSLATNGRHVSGSCLDQVCVSFFIFSSKIVISTRYFIKLVFHFTV
jgi:hypothetical protein